jgi:hypothetical protein
MHTCPAGCHQNPNWSYSMDWSKFDEDDEIFGPLCDQCGAHVLPGDLEAEEDYPRHQVRQYLRFLFLEIVWASIAAFAIMNSAMRWLQQILQWRENQRIDRQWFEQYSGHITDLEQTLHFECPRCAEPDPDCAARLSYSISQAVQIAFRCYQCRRLLSLSERD